MKNITHFFLLSMFSALFVFTACSDDKCLDCDNYDVEKAIVVELPKMYIFTLNDDETRVINTEEELREIFPLFSSIWYGELDSFNPETHTLLIGRTFFEYQANVEHSFYRSQSNKFTYQINVTGIAAATDDFSYGIIVKKLPAKAEVEFKIEYSRLVW